MYVMQKVGLVTKTVTAWFILIGSFVAGSVLLTAKGSSQIQEGDALLQEAPTHYVRTCLFIPQRLQKQASDAMENKYPAKKTAGFLVVDKVIELLARRSQISNLELLKGIIKVLAFSRDSDEIERPVN
jgi:hypothetical protein